MDYVIMAGQLILSLSILVVLHEGGHFFPAKFFNTKVEKFYLFFDPWFSLFKYKKGDTEYGIGWLPLGGYVKIAGMVDESLDTEKLKEPAQPWEFRSKPAWQRLIIMLGGVIVNFILGFFLFAMGLWVYGEEYLPAKNVEHGIYADSLGIEMGLQHGDKILAIGDKPFEKFSDSYVTREIVINSAKTLVIERNDREISLPIDEKFIAILSSYKNKGQRLFTERVPFVLAAITKKSPAEAAGLQEKDKIIALNNRPTPFFGDFKDQIKGQRSTPINMTVLREKDTLQISLTTTENATIGVNPFGGSYFFETAREEYTLGQALPAGTIKGYNFVIDQLKAFGQIFKGKIKAQDSLGSFISIGKLFGGEWNWERFWRMTAILSLILGFMNLLPIPALDGGHVMFLLYEIVVGKKPSDKFLEYATIFGFVILMSLMVLALGLDIFRAIF